MKAMIIGGSLAALAAMAGPTAADTGRYVMEPTGEGFVRMDTETGEMSVCALEGDEVVCRLGADERAAFFDALDALEARVEVLERRLNAGAGSAIARDGLPDPEEFERGLGYMEEFMRRFMGIVEEMEGAPDRT
ncbi:MAG: hypothetical protein JJ920_08670 [Roseitalea sp.]|jgi:hypothetical protein|nr:hypothetical protein [Roseitalea sp.]MBO6722486.1 hypothetical protein [Roseitalea sp.]MBO6742970.1 hypothetical protein [Roseitalea sp.]